MNVTLDFTFPQGTTYTGLQYSTLASLNCIELISHLFLDGPFSALNFLLILRTSILHPNLKFILLCQSACIFVRAIARLFLNVVRLWTGNIATSGPAILSFIYVQPTYVRNFIIHVLVIERILATLYFRSYERWRSIWFSLCWFLVASIVSFLTANARLLFPPDVQVYFGVGTFSSTFVLGLFEVSAFAWMWKHNGRIYQRHSYSLSEKYQLSENIRTAKQLIPCISLHFVNITMGVIQSTLYYAKVYEPNTFYSDLISGQLVFTTSTLLSFLIELSMILYHPFLRRDLLRYWHSLGKCGHRYLSTRANNAISPSMGREVQEENIILKSIQGQPLVPPSSEQMCDEYFRQLSNAWGTKES